MQSFAASCEATWPNGSRIAHWLRPRYATALLVRCNICYRRPLAKQVGDRTSISSSGSRSSSGEHSIHQLHLCRKAAAQRGTHWKDREHEIEAFVSSASGSIYLQLGPCERLRIVEQATVYLLSPPPAIPILGPRASPPPQYDMCRLRRTGHHRCTHT